ncbi:unnamed protein product [Aureobasidium mustum]|uniref:F-box domain-containing protein n=1 Tax=Aureobasidium mustum TaxID=2773714 RepID=A0A9N8JCD0_9PEZI|nr:unnamed protein product [Aureobasidium mustum]
MTGFLNLPFEVRKIVYDNVLANTVGEYKRVFWVPDILEKNIDHQTLAITYRRGSNFRRQGNGPFGAFGSECPAIHHRDTAPLISLARTCKSLHKEVSDLAWKASDFRVQGTLDMICGLLSPRLTLCMPLVTKSSITSLELVLDKPWKVNGLEAMEEIVEMINTHLPALEVLTLSFPHLTLHVPGSKLTMLSICRPARAILAQLLPLRPDLLVAFKAYYHVMRFAYSHYHSSFNAHTLACSQLVALLTSNHAIGRAKAIERKRKKVESACLDADYYIHMTLGLRSSTHYEEIGCCFDHKAQNHMRKIHLPGVKITTRCAPPESDDLGSLLPKEWEQKIED